MADINTGPQPIPVGGDTTGIPVSAIDRTAGAVPTGTPQTPVPPTPIPASAVDRSAGAAPTPYQGGITQSRATATVATTVVTPAGGGSVIPPPAGALPISVADDGSTLTTAVRSFNFVGDGVVAVANTQTNLVTVTITGGNIIGNYSNANVAAYLPTNTSNVSGNYFIGNGSLLTGIASGSSNTIVNGTSNVTIPTANGNVTVNAGDSKQWTFGTDGILTLANGATLKEGVTLGALALGYQAGATSQGIRAVAIGQAAGQTSQGSRAVAIGLSAGTSSQGGFAVAVGASAGQTTQGGYAVAVGYSAGVTSQGNNSIIINATGSTLDQTRANTFTVAPVRNDTSNTANVMFYNATSKEITYGNTIGVAGNITGGNLTTTGIANIATLALTGSATVAGSIAVSSFISASSSITATGNVTAANVIARGTNGNVVVGDATATALPGVSSTASFAVTANRAGTAKELVLSTTGNLVVPGYINNLTDPQQPQDAATKNYVDSVAVGLNIHAAANLATTADLATYTGATVTYTQPNGTGNGAGATLSFAGNTLTTLDGTAIPVATTTRLLVKNQANAVLNGVYNYTSSSLLTRSVGEDIGGELDGGDFLFVLSGATQADTGWIQTTDTVVIGTSNVVFQQFSSAGTYTANTSAGLLLSGSVFSAKVDDNTTAFDGTGNIIVKTSAQFTTPNIGAATGTSLNVTGNITGGNIILTNGAVIRNTAGNALAIGYLAGQASQGSYATAIGFGAGGTSQGTDAIAIGGSAGSTSQGTYGVAIGYLAAQTSQGSLAVALGRQAGYFVQGTTAVAVGAYAGNTSQGQQAVAIGLQAGFASQGNFAVAIGKFAANTSQGTYAVAVGPNAGFENQLANAVAIGSQAGASSQGTDSVAVGTNAAYNTQGSNAVAVGNSAAYLLQGTNSVAIGVNAGIFYLGNSSIAIGANAGNNQQGNNSIIFNATGSNLRNTTANTFTVAPVRNDVANTANVMFYNATSNEITYGNTISVAGNVTGGNINTGTVANVGNLTLVAGANTWNFGTTGTLTIPGGTTLADNTEGYLTGHGLNLTTEDITSGRYSRIKQSINGTQLLAQHAGDAWAAFNVEFLNADFTTPQVQVVTRAQNGATKNWNFSGDGNLTAPGNVSATGNITGGNITTGGLISATANITGGNLTTAGLISATGNITATANIAGGNITTAGLITATGNITGGNLTTAGIGNIGTLAVTGTAAITGNTTVTANIAGGNITTAGLITATGNITGGNLTTAALTSTASLSVTGNTATVTSANYSIGYLNIPQISLSANATTALTDSGKHFYSVSASNLQLTIANNTSVTWPVGTAMTIVNRGTASVIIVPGTGVSLYLAGNSTSANRVVSTYGMATLINVASNIWMINGTVT